MTGQLVARGHVRESRDEFSCKNTSGVVLRVKPANKVVKNEPAEFKRRQATTLSIDFL